MTAFQQIEIEEATDGRHGPILRLFGVNAKGNSVLAHVNGFQPYFYVAAPSGFLNKDLDPLKDVINVGDCLLNAFPARNNATDNKQNVTSPQPPVVSCTIHNRRSLWGFRGNENVPFIKITCVDPKALPRVRDEFFFVIQLQS